MPTRREFLITTAGALALKGQQSEKPRLRRSECFFGMHFDLHPAKSDTALGRDVTDEMIGNFLSRVKPDYIQYDCKGHAGYLGFPSKTGTSSPGIVRDSLEVWRRATARHGVALFIHFSGAWDSLAVAQHPEWARVRPDGKPDDRQTSLWGPYVDALMIPQLKEAAAKYDLDGAWIDGECWAVSPDYCEAAKRAFKEATGLDALPVKAGDPGWLEFLELNRKQFRGYVKHYVDVLHEFRPKFQVASNWLYSTYVPEQPDLPVDFISGDYLGNASISTARLEARYMAQTGKPWDLMAWGFVSNRANPAGPIHKPAAQLQQEAAVVVAQGGGFQIYYQPTRAGHINGRNVAVMERVAKFCRARRELSHKSETVPQIGVLLSTHDLYTASGKLFGGWGRWSDPARGIVDALVENQFPVDVIPEWRLNKIASQYGAIVVPDWRDIGTAVRDTLVEYARSGGKLILAGAETCGLFRDEVPVRFLGTPSNQSAFIPADEVFCNAGGAWQDVEPERDARVLLTRYPTHDDTRDAKCAATVSRLGKGSVAAIYGPLGAIFAATHAPAARQLARAVVSAVWRPAVRVTAPPTVEIVLRRKSGRMMLHLLNATSMQVANDYLGVDYIPAAGPVEIAMSLPAKPRSVTLQPEGQQLAGTWRNGNWTGAVDRVQLHSIVVFE